MTVAEEGEQKEVQPESQPSGGAGEFISLDQARGVALDHARENRDFYGRRYPKMDLAWEVVSQEEQADGYRVQLTYRLAHGFRGNAGVEEFTIDRQGAVRSRRIVSEPVRRGGFLGCGFWPLGSRCGSWCWLWAYWHPQCDRHKSPDPHLQKGGWGDCYQRCQGDFPSNSQPCR